MVTAEREEGGGPPVHDIRGLAQYLGKLRHESWTHRQHSPSHRIHKNSCTSKRSLKSSDRAWGTPITSSSKRQSRKALGSGRPWDVSAPACPGPCFGIIPLIFQLMCAPGTALAPGTIPIPAAADALPLEVWPKQSVWGPPIPPAAPLKPRTDIAIPSSRSRPPSPHKSASLPASASLALSC